MTFSFFFFFVSIFLNLFKGQFKNVWNSSGSILSQELFVTMSLPFGIAPLSTHESGVLNSK